MPKVLRIINRFNIGGPTYNVAYLTKYLPPEFETKLIGGQKEETEDSSEYILHELGINPTILPNMQREISFVKDWQTYRQLKKIITEYKPDIVHTHAAKAGVLGRLAAISCRVPVVIHTFHGHVFHSYFGKLKTLFYLTIERYLAARSTCIIAISEIQKVELSDEFKITYPEKIKVIPLGFDLTKFNEDKERKRMEFRKEFAIPDDVLAIGIIGRFAPIKNHVLFLMAFADAIKKTNQKIVAVLIGDGELRTVIEEEIKQLNIVDAVIFTSWQKHVDQVLAGLDIVALSSDNEGTPVSLIEAQAAGKPIVSTNPGGIQDVVIPNQTALLSAPGDLKTFSDNLLRMIEDKNLRESYAAKGWEFVKEKFHYNRLTNDMANLYHQLLGR